jgi:hypothetical protein
MANDSYNQPFLEVEEDTNDESDDAKSAKRKNTVFMDGPSEVDLDSTGLDRFKTVKYLVVCPKRRICFCETH